MTALTEVEVPGMKRSNWIARAVATRRATSAVVSPGGGAQLFEAHRRHLDVEIDAVEEGPETRPVALDERWRTAAVVPWVSQVAAGSFLRSLSAMSPFPSSSPD
jgi:hypothetical protein